jgi:NTP pyrophosphatase (non-canonical NTP hydrolase)
MKTENYSLVDLAVLCHENSRDHGFYEGYDMTNFKDISTKIALIHSEATEVLEAVRKEKGSIEIVEEMADILIRTFDLYAALVNAGVVDQDLDEVLENKMEKNKGRPYMHGVLG